MSKIIHSCDVCFAEVCEDAAHSVLHVFGWFNLDIWIAAFIASGCSFLCTVAYIEHYAYMGDHLVAMLAICTQEQRIWWSRCLWTKMCCVDGVAFACRIHWNTCGNGEHIWKQVIEVYLWKCWEILCWYWTSMLLLHTNKDLLRQMFNGRESWRNSWDASLPHWENPNLSTTEFQWLVSLGYLSWKWTFSNVAT